MWINNNKEQSLVYKPIFTDCLTHAQKKDVEGFPPLNVDDCAEINRHFTPYIFYRRTSQGRYTCFCTSCNHEFKVNSNDYGDIYHTDNNIIRHNYLGTCPCCGVKAEYKAAGYKQVQLNEVVDFVIYKAVEEVVYIYAATIHKDYNEYGTGDFDRSPDLWVDFQKLYVLRKGSAEVYHSHASFRPNGWCYMIEPMKRKMCSSFNNGFADHRQVYLYKNIIKDTFLKYSGFDCYCCRHYIREYDQERYYTAYAMYPILELAVKMNCDTMVQDLLWRNKKNYKILNWNATSPKKFFKHLTLNEVKAFLEDHTSASVIEVYQDFKRKGKKKDIFYCRMYSYITNYCTCIEKANVDPGQVLEYLKRIMKHASEEDRCQDDHAELRRLVRLYDDYANIGLKIGYDFRLKNIAFPRDLNEAHDNAVENFNFMKEERKRKEAAEREEAYKPRYKKLCKKYKGYSYPGIQLVVPKNAESIIKEGKDLQICVGGYASRHCNGATTILFIRKPSDLDKSWFTIEIDNADHIVQCHGFKNEQAKDPLTGKKLEKPEIIKAFEVNFQEWLNSKKKQNKRRKAS